MYGPTEGEFPVALKCKIVMKMGTNIGGIMLTPHVTVEKGGET
jgi:hypothetical protein